MVIGLNPSTADEKNDDPTIRRCIDFAKRWGFGALCMTNIFAYRATKPEDMKAQDNPYGMDNVHWLLQCADGAGMILAAWGKHGRHVNGDISTMDHLQHINAHLKLHALKLNKDGSPMHPLYVAGDTKPMPYSADNLTSKK